MSVLPQAIETLSHLPDWNRTSIHDALMTVAEQLDLKTGQVMWPVRIAASGQAVTPGGAVEILVILGKAESLERLGIGLDLLANP